MHKYHKLFTVDNMAASKCRSRDLDHDLFSVSKIK